MTFTSPTQETEARGESLETVVLASVVAANQAPIAVERLEREGQQTRRYRGEVAA